MAKHDWAVLWDLDGVIADTGEYHYQAWKAIFAKKGLDYPKDEFMRHFGQRHDTIIYDALGEDIPTAEFNAITEEKQAEYRRLVAKDIRALPGALELIRALKTNGIKQGIASSAPPPNIAIILQGLGIEHDFQAITPGTEVARSKPDPGIFLATAKKLKMDPARCVVIEDAIAGVAAAKSAGMKCIAVMTSHPAEKLKAADLIVPTLEKVNIETINKLFADKQGAI